MSNANIEKVFFDDYLCIMLTKLKVFKRFKNLINLKFEYNYCLSFLFFLDFRF